MGYRAAPLPTCNRRGVYASLTYQGCVAEAESFLIGIAGNPLKSPDSEKLIKENESTFVFICFRGFAFV
jgi:hypothetical protein